MKIVFYLILFIVGTCFGSFLCCQARRLHHNASHRSGQLKSKRSICLHCHYQLKWYDNIPIVSWLILKGKCRKCHRSIGVAELLSEFGLGLAFLISATSFNPITAQVMDWLAFIVNLIFICIISFLAIYDGLYGELPTRYLVMAIVVALMILGLHTAVDLQSQSFTPALIWQPLTSVLILGGLYLLLYLVSRGKWVGDGDWLLATALSIVLAHPWSALIALFLANFIACLVALPSLKSAKTHKIYFGPFLVIAFILTPLVTTWLPLL